MSDLHMYSSFIQYLHDILHVFESTGYQYDVWIPCGIRSIEITFWLFQQLLATLSISMPQVISKVNIKAVTPVVVGMVEISTWKTTMFFQTGNQADIGQNKWLQVMRGFHESWMKNSPENQDGPVRPQNWNGKSFEPSPLHFVSFREISATAGSPTGHHSWVRVVLRVSPKGTTIL